MQNREYRLAVVALVVSVFSVLLAAFAIWQNEQLQQQDHAFDVKLEDIKIQRERPRLEANSLDFKPALGRPGVTPVPLFNAGKQQSLIVKMEYQIVQRFETPREPQKAGAVEHYSLYFRASDYDESARAFSAPFRHAVGVSGSENAVFVLAIVEPAWSGYSYSGNLLVHYDRGPPLIVANVQLDVLDNAPRDPHLMHVR